MSVLVPLGRGFSRLLDLLAPTSCAGCDRPNLPNSAFCAECLEELEPPPERSVDGRPVLALASYGGPVATAVKRLKFGGRSDLAGSLGGMLAEVLVSGGQPLVPVPLHRKRLRERGYNQAALLARAAARRAGVAHHPRLLDRVRCTARQAQLDHEQRQHNVARAFVVRRGGAPLGRKQPAEVVLVDDVVTTGATVAACIDALGAAGVSVSAVLALAIR